MTATRIVGIRFGDDPTDVQPIGRDDSLLDLAMLLGDADDGITTWTFIHGSEWKYAEILANGDYASFPEDRSAPFDEAMGYGEFEDEL